jgi:hypothetical protein
VTDAFCASRLAGDWGWALGTLPPGLALDAIVERATPVLKERSGSPGWTRGPGLKERSGSPG